MVTEAKLKLIRENWRLKYSAYFVLCPLRSNLKFVPDSVAVKYAANDTVSNLLSVIDNRKFRNNKQNLAVCIKPIHYNFNNVSGLESNFQNFEFKTFTLFSSHEYLNSSN